MPLLQIQSLDLKIAGGGRANMETFWYSWDVFQNIGQREFISHGYKVTKVDQVESLLAKEMREEVGPKKKKIIRRGIDWCSNWVELWLIWTWFPMTWLPIV